MKRILLAIKSLECCRSAFSFVSRLISDTNYHIDLVHIFDINTTTLASSSGIVIHEAIAEKKEETQRWLQQLMTILPEKHRGQVFAIYGIQVSAEIVRCANDVNCHLIVTALRGSYNIVDRIIGTVTQQIFNKAERPVLAVPFNAEFSQINEILFPSNVSHFSHIKEKDEDDLDWVLSQHDLWADAKINMIHIHEGKQGLDIVENNYPYSSMRLIHSFSKTVEEGLLKYIKKKKFDLIVLQKVNRSFWEDIFHKSITKSILFNSKAPVLLV